DDDGHVRYDLRTGPTLRLLEELELEVIDAQGTKFGPGKVEQLVPLRRPLAEQQVHLVVAVEVVLVLAVPEFDPLEKLVGDVRVAGSGAQGRKPVEAGEKAVLDGARLDLARPASDARHSEATLVGRSLLALERRVAAVRPGECLGSVVGAEDEDGVLGLA